MHPSNEESTSFIMDKGLYCYKVMPFCLKNVETTYKKLVNRMIADLIIKTMKVYVDDTLVKSFEATNHVEHLEAAFNSLKEYRMRLNPLKCTFWHSVLEVFGLHGLAGGNRAEPR